MLFYGMYGSTEFVSIYLRTYLSGIRQLQIAGGFPDPLIDHVPRLRQILKGIKV